MSSRRIPSRMAAFALALAFPALALASDDAKENESGSPGYLGIRMQRVEGGLAEALDLKDDGGVLVGQVLDESPADKAGLQEGDVVVKVDGTSVGTPTELRDSVREKSAGEVVKLDVLRDGKSRTITVTLGESDDDDVVTERIERRVGDGDRKERVRIERGPHGQRGRGPEWLGDGAPVGKHGWLGVMTQPLSADLGDYFGVKDGHGALVSEVVEGSPAAKLGLRAGDVITKVDGEAVEDPGDLMQAVRTIDTEKEVEVVWTREKRERTGRVAIELREGPAGESMRDHVRALRDGPRKFMRRFNPQGGEGMGPGDTPRFEMRDEDMAELREELKALKEELKRMKEELRGE